VVQLLQLVVFVKDLLFDYPLLFIVHVCILQDFGNSHSQAVDPSICFLLEVVKRFLKELTVASVLGQIVLLVVQGEHGVASRLGNDWRGLLHMFLGLLVLFQELLGVSLDQLPIRVKVFYLNLELFLSLFNILFALILHELKVPFIIAQKTTLLKKSAF
jgi:hypothetical protein